MPRPTLVRLSPALLVVAGLSAPAVAQLRVVSYNVSANRAGVSTVLQAIGNEARNGIARPIDVLALQEQSGTATADIVAALNTLYGAGTYARSTLVGASTGAGSPGLIYRTASVQLVSSATVGTTSSSGAARQGLRYQLRPSGYGSSADIYLYNNHYRSSESGASERNVEAQAVRANANALPNVAAANIVYAGDLNVYSASEAMFVTLRGTAAGTNGRAIDPINHSWSESNGSRFAHTQSPVVTQGQFYGGQIGGGMDDRFDFQLITAPLQDSEGMSYIAGSYRAFGNNGTHALNGSITSGSGASSTVLDALARASDHIPVVADYQLPARMGVTVGTTPATVIRGAVVGATVTVANTAPVAVAPGADELDYVLTTNGSLTGSATGTTLALATGNAFAVGLNTATVGARGGQVLVNASSQSAANASFSQTIAYQVIDHAQPSFDAGGRSSIIDIDFDQLTLGAPALTEAGQLANLVSSLGGSAGLDLDQIIGTGDTNVLSIDLSTFTALAAGNAVDFSMLFAPTTVGDFAATYTLKLSDANNLPGATDLDDLTILLRGTAVAVPEPGAALLSLMAATLLMNRRRPGRRHSTNR